MYWWPLIWLAIIIASVVIEKFLKRGFALSCACPAIISMLLAVCRVEIIAQIIVFMSLSVATLMCFRQYIIKVAYLRKLEKQGETIIGRQLRLISSLRFDKMGKVILDDIIWNVETRKESEIAEGEIVEVVEVGINKLIVKLT